MYSVTSLADYKLPIAALILIVLGIMAFSTIRNALRQRERRRRAEIAKIRNRETWNAVISRNG